MSLLVRSRPQRYNIFLELTRKKHKEIPIRNKQLFFFLKKSFNKSLKRGLFFVGIRPNMKNRLMDVHDKIMLRKRSMIETINDMLKNVAQIVHTRHRSISNFIVNLLAGMAAYAFYDTRPSINMEFVMNGEAEVKQLTLF